MELRVLGCSGGIGVGLSTTSLLVDDDIVIDAGSGLGQLSLNEMAAIRHVFITHSHLDHLTHLPFLLDCMFERIKQPIVVHAEPATLQALRQHIFNWIIWPDFTKLPSEDAPVLAFQSMVPGDVETVGGRDIEMIRVNHVVPGVGYRVSSATGSFAFSGDTTTNDTFWQALNSHDRLDLLLVEVAFGDGDHLTAGKAKHYCPLTLAQDLVKFKQSAEIYLTHLKPGHEHIIVQQVQQHLPDRTIKVLKGNEVFTL